MVVTASNVEQLSNVFAGTLLAPGDEGYEEARQVQNGMIDRHPALIARCLGVRDIIEAVRYARVNDLEVSVRGGGHNVAGRAVTEGGLMIDLAEMRGVFVDPQRNIAVAQGGATWGDFYRETELHGLSTTGGVVSTTGVAGLTLGGGLGYLMGSHGLSVDNLRRVELVTASGEVISASAEESPDLFWALRGGGGNFGIAASLEFDLHEVPATVLGGIVAHPIEAAGDVLRFYRDLTAAGIPDELQLFASVLHAPDGSGLKIAAIVCAHSGPADEAEAALRPIREFGAPILDTVAPMAVSELNAMLDGGSPKGALNYWKSNFLAELSDDAIDSIVDAFSEALPPMNGVLLEHLHGAATRVAPDATAFTHRVEGHNLLVLGVWLDPAENDTNIAWVRSVFDRMSPHFSDARYVNYVGDDEGEAAPDAAYGSVYDRLREVKRQYDPDNVFHLNQNIVP